MAETYDKFQERIVRDAQRIQEKADADFARQRLVARGQGWLDGYEAGKAEQAERDRSQRWHDAIFAFLVGGIAGFLAAAVLTWASQ